MKVDIDQETAERIAREWLKGMVATAHRELDREDWDHGDREFWIELGMHCSTLLHLNWGE